MPEIPDVYTDAVNVSSNVWGVTLYFGTRPIGESETDEPGLVQGKAIIRMSHLHAKVMAIMMRRILTEYEDASGVPIPIPDVLMERFELQGEAW